MVNPTNLWPIFTQDQLISSLHAMYLATPVIHHAVSLYIEKLHNDIHSNLHLNPSLQHIYQPLLHLTGLWAKADFSTNMIRFMSQTLWTSNSKSYSINMIISCWHYRQNKTLQLIWCDYVWPNLHTFIQQFCSSCTTCKGAKAPWQTLWIPETAAHSRKTGIQFPLTLLSSYQTPMANYNTICIQELIQIHKTKEVFRIFWELFGSVTRGNFK